MSELTAERVRRGRGFNKEEVANLRSWGYEPRPDEVEPDPPPELTGQLNYTEVARTVDVTALADAQERRIHIGVSPWLVVSSNQSNPYYDPHPDERWGRS